MSEALAPEFFRTKSLFAHGGPRDPKTWLVEAVGLSRSAEVLMERWQSRAKELHIPQSGVNQLDVFDFLCLSKTYLLISGLALENLLKGILIARDKEIVSGKRLKWGTASHDLKALYRRAGFTPSIAENDVLETLSEAVQWSGRYPVPMKHDSADRLLLFAKDRQQKGVLPCASFADMATYHQTIYDSLFKRIFDLYPASTHPWRLETEPQGPKQGQTD